jgi:hypothetical protein
MPNTIDIQNNPKADRALPLDKYQKAFGVSPTKEVSKPGSQAGRKTVAITVPAIIAKNTRIHTIKLFVV